MSAPAGAPYPTRFLLVDGSGLLFQMFYGMPARIVNGEGKAYGGTLGFIGALRRILQMVQPAHAAVFFDGEHENPRTGLDAGYKANRPDFSAIAGEDTPFSQLPDVYAALDFLGIRHAETTDCEADDLIAAYCAQCGADVQVVIASQDHDFFPASVRARDAASIPRKGNAAVYACLCTREIRHRTGAVCPFSCADRRHDGQYPGR